MAKTTRGFTEGHRYRYDLGKCSYAEGWAQFDTAQDASYYGRWVNPTRMTLFCYVEGDTTMVECESEAEFAKAVREASDWHARNDGVPGRIDAGFTPGMRERFERLGLGDLLH